MHRHLRPQHFVQVPTDGFPFAVFVGRQKQFFGVLHQVAELLHVLRLAGRNHVQRIEILIHVHSQARPGLIAILGRNFLGPLRQIANVPNARLDRIVAAQELADRLGLGGRFDDHQAFRVFAGRLLGHINKHLGDKLVKLGYLCVLIALYRPHRDSTNYALPNRHDRHLTDLCLRNHCYNPHQQTGRPSVRVQQIVCPELVQQPRNIPPSIGQSDSSVVPSFKSNCTGPVFVDFIRSLRPTGIAFTSRRATIGRSTTITTCAASGYIRLQPLRTGCQGVFGCRRSAASVIPHDTLGVASTPTTLARKHRNTPWLVRFGCFARTRRS